MDEAEKQIEHFVTVHATEIRRHELITLGRWSSADKKPHGVAVNPTPDGVQEIASQDE